MRRWQIDSSVTAYIKYQIESGVEQTAKNGLQYLCELYRTGGRIRSNEELNAIEQSVVGLLYTKRNNPKLQRWALNAIAELGRRHTTIEVVLEALDRHQDDPQISAAAIAALHSLDRNASQTLRSKNFPYEIVVLSALQRGSVPEEELAKVRVNIEKADPDILKLSLVAVGLDKAPENIFDPRHPNSKIVRVLGGHHDRIVSQYSIWAITENPSLSIKDLGVPLKDVEAKPPNVRAWMYKLIAMDSANTAEYIDYVRLGSEDEEAEARSGLAHGLRKSYFDGLEELTLDWFPNEADREVRDRLVDHAVFNADRCPSYERLAMDLYEAETEGSALRRRMDAAAAGKAIYGKFRVVSTSGGRSLFDAETVNIFGDINMAKNVTNVTGNIQGGAVSVGGDATNSGSVQFDQRQLEIVGELAKAERELHNVAGHGEFKQQVLKVIADAKADPSPTKLEAAIRGLKKISDVSGMAEKTVKAITEIGKRLITLGGLALTLF